VADFFLKKAAKEQHNESLQNFCLSKGIGFMIEAENLKAAYRWIMDGKIVIDGVELKSTLTHENKYDILQTVYCSKDFTLDEKTALKAKVFESDSSDKGARVQKICSYSLPDAELKAKLWAEIIDPESKDSLMELNLKMQGFWRREMQLDLIQPYFHKYYEVVHEVVEKRDREVAEAFISTFSPAFMAREEDEVHFKELLEKANKERNFYVIFLKKQLEVIKKIRQSRELCEKS